MHFDWTMAVLSGTQFLATGDMPAKLKLYGTLILIVGFYAVTTAWRDRDGR